MTNTSITLPLPLLFIAIAWLGQDNNIALSFSPVNSTTRSNNNSKTKNHRIHHEQSHESSTTHHRVLLFDKSSPEEESDDNNGEDEDWRAFRAKLVMSEGGNAAGGGTSSPSIEDENTAVDDGPIIDDSDLDGFGALFSESSATSSPSSFAGFTPLDPSQWAYDSGKVIEKGAVILGGVEQDFGFGLRQQYFHKAVILVLDHDENTFTKGIILNRPSDRMMEDDVNEGLKWRVWFGGDVQGLDSILPEVVCLHSLKSKEAKDASVSVMKDIQVSWFSQCTYNIRTSIS